MIVVIFKIQFSILDYCLDPVPEFYLLNIALILCFKAILIVALSGYVIRYETLNPSYITRLPSNASLCLRAPMMLSLQLSHLSCSLFGLTQD